MTWGSVRQGRRVIAFLLLNSLLPFFGCFVLSCGRVDGGTDKSVCATSGQNVNDTGVEPVVANTKTIHELLEPVWGLFGPVALGVAFVEEGEGGFGIVFAGGVGAAVTPGADYEMEGFGNAWIFRVGIGPVQSLFA